MSGVKHQKDFRIDMDIIILAIIAAAVVFKLYKVLGDKRFDPGTVASKIPVTTRPKDQPKELKLVSAPSAEEIKARETEQEKKYGAVLWQQIKELQKVDRYFNPDVFIEGAKDAFGLIITAYAKEETARLQGLVGKTMFSTLEAEIARRKAQNEIHETTLIAVKSAEIKKVEWDKKSIQITIRFRTEQVNLIKDVRGKIIEGDPSEIDEVTDIWTFERPLHTSDPNWLLIKATLE